MAEIVSESLMDARLISDKGSNASSVDHSGSSNGTRTSATSSFDMPSRSASIGGKPGNAHLFGKSTLDEGGPHSSIQNLSIVDSTSQPPQDIKTLKERKIDRFANHFEQSDLSNGRTASLDGKSIGSEMVGLDEKDSLRPDDSASLQAFGEEDGHSIADSAVTGGSKVQRLREAAQQLAPPDQDGKLAMASTNQLLSCVNGREDTPRQSEAILPPGYTRQDPDEKLIDALDTPKDRIFVLRLEQDVIEFVRDSRKASLDLPPVNSFYRMLTHKLADYYFLTHFVDQNSTAIRLFRTPFCRLPPPLTGIVNPLAIESTPPSSAPSVKIMRRLATEKDEIRTTSSAATSSDGRSKPASEQGLDETQGPTLQSPDGKERSNLTREQKEAKYKEARERIFKDFAESNEGEAATVDKEVSRASSVAGKKKNARRQRMPKDDSFEARSQYAAIYHPQLASPDSEASHRFRVEHLGQQYPILPHQAAHQPYPPVPDQWHQPFAGQPTHLPFSPFKQVPQHNGYAGPNHEQHLINYETSRHQAQPMNPQWSGSPYSQGFPGQPPAYFSGQPSYPPPNHNYYPMPNPQMMGSYNASPPSHYPGPAHNPGPMTLGMQPPTRDYNRGPFDTQTMSNANPAYPGTMQSYSNAPFFAQSTPDSPGFYSAGSRQPSSYPDHFSPGTYPPQRFAGPGQSEGFFGGNGPIQAQPYPPPPEQSSIKTWATPASLPPKPDFTGMESMAAPNGKPQATHRSKTKKKEGKAHSGGVSSLDI